MRTEGEPRCKGSMAEKCEKILQLGSRPGRPSGDPSFLVCKSQPEQQLGADKIPGNENGKEESGLWIYSCFCLFLLQPGGPSGTC